MALSKELIKTLGRGINAWLINKGVSIGSAYRLKYLAHELGLHSLGNGSFSCVVEHPTDRTKVIKIGLGCGSSHKDDGWLYFANYAIRHPSPMFPKIDDIFVFSSCYIAVMEKLQEYIGKDRDFHNLLMCCDKHAQWVEPIVEALGKPSDLRIGNVMLRGTQLVWSDPYSDCLSKDHPWYTDKFIVDEELDVTVEVTNSSEHPKLRPTAVQDMDQERIGLRKDDIIPHRLRRMHTSERLGMVRELDKLLIRRALAGAQPLNCPLPMVAPAGKSPEIWPKNQNPVLRIKSKHDCVAHASWLHGALLSRRQSRRISSAWSVDISAALRAGRCPRGYHEALRRKTSTGLLSGYTKGKDAVAFAKRYRFRFGKSLWLRLQRPFWKGYPAGAQRRKVGGIHQSGHRRINSQVHREAAE